MKTSGNFQKPAQTFDNLDRMPIRHSGFDLSHRHTTTFNMGEVIPIALLEVIPNDSFDLGAEAVLRMQPLVAPILHPVHLKIQAFFGPNRILTPSSPGAWEEFITGGDQGSTVINLQTLDPAGVADAASEGSLWDRFGCNPIFDASATTIAASLRPLAYPWFMYAKMWNDWFRVPGIQAEVDIETFPFLRPFYQNWPRDYFTSALPFLQRGISPSLPVLGTISASSTSASTFNFAGAYGVSGSSPIGIDAGSFPGQLVVTNAGDGAQFDTFATNAGDVNTTTTTTVTPTLSTVDTKQIRLAFLYQAFLERMARGGARYAEMLPNIWGARPLDQRLNRIEFIGGFTAPWLTSEVLQTAPQTDNGTSGDTTVQGTMAGHGINLAQGNLGRYRVDEHGWIMITAVVYPDSAYQNGMPRALLRRTREEFPSPMFAGLSEQEIFNAELFNQTIATDPTGSIGRTPFGYTGRYNEMRYQPNIVSSEMRSTLDYWHLGRKFTALPTLNSDFMNMESDDDINNLRRIFAVQNVPGIIGTFGLKVHVRRPIPFIAVPAQLGGG